MVTGIVVQNDPVDPGQQPLARLPVHIKLITGADNAPGYTATGSIIGRYTTQTDDNGNWTATLVPNSQITPANTYYQVQEGFAVSNIVVPASGGPYTLSQLLATPPPTPGAPGITGVQIAVGGTVDGVRPEINLIAGTNVGITAADNPGNNRVDVTITAAGGGGGGAVSSVFGRAGAVVAANGDYSAGQITGLGSAALQPTSAFDASGAAATAQSNAIAAAASSAAGLYIPLAAEGANGGVATLDGSGHLTTAQAANLVSADWASMLGVALLTARFTESDVTYQQTPGDFVLCLCTAAKTKTISQLALWVTVAGVTGSGVNELAIYDETGTLIDQTGDMTATWSSAGMVDGALGGSHTVTAGVNYYLAFLTHFSGTSPHLAATGTAQTANFPVYNGHRTAIFKSGVSAIPASFDPSTYTPNSGYFILAAR